MQNRSIHCPIAIGDGDQPRGSYKFVSDADSRGRPALGLLARVNRQYSTNSRYTSVYLSQGADTRQSMGQLLSWFPVPNDRTIYIIIRLQEPAVEQPEEPETSGKGMRKRKGKGRARGGPS